MRLGDANLDLGADERVRNRVEEVMDLDVIIEVDPWAQRIPRLPVLGGQRGQGITARFSRIVRAG